MKNWQLVQRQELSLEAKVELSKLKIRQFYNHFLGDVSVSFSGGKDSTVLLYLVRSLYPNVSAVFADTGLEYPEIREFVKTIENVTWVKPKMTFSEVLKKYGFPVISKEVSQKIYEARTTKSKKLLHKRLHGADNKYKSGKIPNKWQHLIKAPFNISHRCCHYLKIKPMQGYRSFVGTMASDSHARKQKYLRSGCNSFESKKQYSMPMAFWLEKDVWQYIKKYQLHYSKIYDMGYDRTGCMFCMFGVHLEKSPNKFQRMKTTHPKQHDYCINKLGCGKVMNYAGIKF